ncbi:MAG: PEGA domain-containing protein [Bacteroidales bacterium]|nr:PEGA domain-containing protein [Bacteroidales bacterium]
MRKKVIIQITAVLLILTILLSSCASTTVLQSSPSGAKLYMNGEPVGTTPYTHTDTKIVGTTTILKITSDGYEDFNGVLVRNEEANVGAIIGGIFLLFPFLWVMDYKPMHNFELVPSKK